MDDLLIAREKSIGPLRRLGGLKDPHIGIRRQAGMVVAQPVRTIGAGQLLPRGRVEIDRPDERGQRRLLDIEHRTRRLLQIGQWRGLAQPQQSRCAMPASNRVLRESRATEGAGGPKWHLQEGQGRPGRAPGRTLAPNAVAKDPQAPPHGADAKRHIHRLHRAAARRAGEAGQQHLALRLGHGHIQNGAIQRRGRGLPEGGFEDQPGRIIQPKGCSGADDEHISALQKRDPADQPQRHRFGDQHGAAENSIFRAVTA